MKTRYRAATIPIFPRTKMGMIFLYIHIPHILHILSTQSPQTNHTRRLPCSIPFSIFIAIPYIPCRFFSQRPHPLVLVFVLDALRHSRFSFVVAQWGGLCRFPFVVSSGVAVGRGVSFRSSSCRVGSLGDAPFLPARFAVPLFSSRSSRPSSRRIVPFAGRSFCRPVRRLVVRFGFHAVSWVVSSCVS